MVTVCQICGDRGFEEALVYCDSCKIAAMHRYCLGITPVPFEEYITWFCEECDGSDRVSDSEEVDMTIKLRDVLKKKKSKESSSHASPVKAAEDNGIQKDTSNVENEEVSSSPTIIETVKETERRGSLDNGNSDESNGLVRNEATVLEVGDGASVSEKVAKEKKKKKKKKKKRKSIDHTLPVLPVEDHGLPDATIVEPVEVSKKRQSSEELRNEATVMEVGDGASVSEKGEKEKKKKKKKKRKSIDQSLPALAVEDHSLPDATNVEPVEVSMKKQSSDELNGLVRNEATVLEAGDGASVSEKGEKEKKKKRKSMDQSLPALPVDDHLLPDASIVETVEVSKKRQRSGELISLVRNEASVLEAGDGASASDKGEKEKKKKKKKKKRKSSNHSLPVLPVEDHQLPDANNVEPAEVSDKRQRSEESNGLAINKASVLVAGDGASASDKGEKEKKKKKKRKSSNHHSLPVLPAEDHVLPDATSVEPVEVSDKRRRSEESNGLVRNETTVLEAGDGAIVLEKGEKEKKKKKKRKSINHSLPVLSVEDHGLPDATIVEPVGESKKRKSSEESNGIVRDEVSVLEKSEKKKKKTNKEVKKKKKKEESSNNTLPVIRVEDHVLHATNKETTDDSERREGDNGKSHELSGLVKSAASSVSEARNSSTVPDHSSCTSKKRKLSCGNIRVTCVNTQLEDADDNSCKEAESYMPRTAMDFNSPALTIDRAQPILEPTWRGSISIKNRNIGNIDGLVAHLSSLACYQVHEKASTLQGRLYAEMVPRLEIWPNSFLKNGGPMDDSIALYFFPSSESNSNHEAVFYSLVREMKKSDSAMKCVLDSAELILFTSYQLPMHCWTFHSKEYLWGAFKPRKTSRP